MIEFKTKFNESSTTAINDHQMRKLKAFYIIFSSIFVVLGLLLLASALEEYNEGSSEYLSTMIEALIFIAMGTLFTPLVRCLTKLLQKRINKTTTLLRNETEETYKFDEDKMYIFTNCGDNYRSAIETTYDYLFRVDETSTHYFLYISSTQCHVLNKADIVEGTIEELNQIFSKNFDSSRYKKFYK